MLLNFIYRNRRVYFDSYDSIYTNIQWTDYEKALREGIDTILDFFKDSRGHYIIISKSKKFGIQLDWRPDNFDATDKLNHGYTATTLDSVTQKDVTKHDTKLFVEDFKKNGVEHWFITEDYDEMIRQTGYYAIFVENCPGYKMYIKEGKIYSNFQIVNVE